MGPRAIPEEWVRDDKVVHYLIPKTFVDWLTPKFGETGIYSLLTMGTLALASKEYLVFHIETKIAIEFFVTWSLLNMLFGDSVREMAADQFTASYDRLTPSRNTISKPMAKSLNNTKKLKCKLKVKHFSINKN